MGWVDIFRKMWGWLSGQSAQAVPPMPVREYVNFVSPVDRDDFKKVRR